MLSAPCRNRLLNVNTLGKIVNHTLSQCGFPKRFDVQSFPTTCFLQNPEWEPDVITLFSTRLLWEYPGNWLITASVNARIVYRGREPPLGMSRHPQRPMTVQWAFSKMLFHTKNGNLRLCVCVCGTRPSSRTAVYALYIINEHAERNHKGCSALHNALVSKAVVRGHVWVWAWAPRTNTNKESFESEGGYMYITWKQKDSWLHNRRYNRHFFYLNL